MDSEFPDWYQANHHRVAAAIRLAAGSSPAQAVESTDEAFVRAYEQWGRVSNMDNPTGWVVRVGINHARSAWTRQRRLADLVASIRQSTETFDPEPGVDIEQALAELPPRQRQAIVLRYFDQLEQQEVADHMKIKAGTAAATLNHARTTLRASRHLTTGDNRDD